MSWLGNFAAGVTLNTKFTTVDTTGAPTVLSGATISVYKSNSTTQSTAGVTFTGGFDSVTGLNNVNIDLSSDGTFYAAGGDFQIVITAGTVGGTSVAGYVVAEFSIQNRYTGANVISMAANTLTASALATDAVTEIQTGLATPTNITAGVITTVTNLTNAPGSGDLTTTMKTSVQTASAAAITAASLPTAAQINTTLSGVHGAGSWEGGGGSAPTVEEIDAQLSSTHGDGSWEGTGGGGVFTYVFNLFNEDTDAPIAGAQVQARLSTNPASEVVAAGVTDLAGNVTLAFLGTGSAFIWALASGYEPLLAYEITVT